MRHDHVHVTFDDDYQVFGADRGSGHIDTVNGAAFVKDSRLRRIDIFGLGTILLPAGKSRSAATGITNGEHQAVVETVAGSSFLIFHDQSRIQHFAFAEILFLQIGQQVFPGVRTDPELKIIDRLHGQTTPQQVVFSFFPHRGIDQQIVVILHRRLVNLE